MKTVILCGGMGTRIRDLSEDLPKPMIPIGGYPIVQHIMDIYSHYDHNDFVLCLGYKSWNFKEYFLNFRAATSDLVIDLASDSSVEFLNAKVTPPWKITLAETGLDAMTGCRIKRIGQYVGDETFMLTYGDGVSDIDIEALLKFHRAHGKLVTMTAVRPPSRFGELVIEGDQITDFQEKPQTADGLINGGFFVCEPGVFDYVEDIESCIFEQKPLQKLARDGELMSYTHEGFWMPMDTSREYTLLNEMWQTDTAPWKK